jgi:8-oxo-dGTP pyrophosphatase MutT (NUDIX family)
LNVRTDPLSASAPGIVRAAGGIVWRQGPSGIEVALVHRPAYDDWTFPKGKLASGEEEEEGALREVEEETGLHCELERFVGLSRYQDRRGRDKVVAYWTMLPTRGRFSPSREVDELRWVPIDEAASVLTYDRDRVLLRALDPPA